MADYTPTGFSKEDVKLVQRTFQMVTKVRADFAKTLFMKLFTGSPEVLRMYSFGGDEASPIALLSAGSPAMRHAEKVLDALQVAIEALENEEELPWVLGLLSEKHRALGVELRHYTVFREAFFASLEVALFFDFNAAVRTAWRRVFDSLQQMLITGDTSVLGSKGTLALERKSLALERKSMAMIANIMIRMPSVTSSAA
eukprot:TRINITY_DN33083_c0_g1_i1.p1 TRINITY_DN33083_c0_g1~~TRINITY_DN33083_c0_g1_i1.p1  ORF type:complete len:199 (+),score=59.19 TRINITY_DN33083_c0_g1_i1:91-687(+)